MMDNHILPECFLDTNMMESLLPTKIGYNHQKSCNGVIKAMQEKFQDIFALGVLDIDKDTPEKLKQKGFNELTTKHELKLYKHTANPHYLILHPNIEKWLIEESKQISLSLEDYQLSNNLDELKKQSKPKTSKNDDRFKKLFKALKKNKSNGITQLFEWTDYLIKNPYNATQSELENIGNPS